MNSLKEDSRRLERIEAIVSSAVNLLLGLLKVIVGYKFSIHVLIADGFHSFSDLGSSLIMYISSVLASPPPDRDHPYGHGKALVLGEYTMSLLLILIALEIAISAISNLLSAERISISGGKIGMAIALLSIAVKLVLSLLSLVLGKVANSNLLKLDGLHHMTDAISSVLALIGIWGAQVGMSWLEPAMTLVIGAMIVKLGVENLTSSLNILMDKTDERLSEALFELLNEELRDSVDRVITRSYGETYVVEVRLKPELASIGNLRAKLETLRDEIKRRYPNISSVYFTVLW